MELTCPKCHGAMRSYERSGILIDQCTECRGVFLDRGELDKLIDAEAEHQQAGAAPTPPAPAHTPAWGSSQPPGYGDRHRDDDRYRDDRYREDQYRYDDDNRYGKKRKRSFLDELFD
jgi:Zn-finger nucleic acid-binding protein